jgi:hypothetical protein
VCGPGVLSVAGAGARCESRERYKGSECANVSRGSKAANGNGAIERQTVGLLIYFRGFFTRHIPLFGDAANGRQGRAQWFGVVLVSAHQFYSPATRCWQYPLKNTFTTFAALTPAIFYAAPVEEGLGTRISSPLFPGSLVLCPLPVAKTA